MTNCGVVYIVGAGPGDPDLITVKGLRCLRNSDVILHDRLISTGLLIQVPGDAILIDVGKRFGHEDRQQPEIHKLMIEYAREGKTVCRLKGGDPFIFGRGGEEADALLAARIPFEIVPGVSSVTAAAVAAGFPLTHREHNHGFLVITGSRSAKFDAAEWCAARTLLKSGGTVVVFMGLVRLEAITENLIQNGCSPDLPAALVSRATWPTEETRAGTLRTILDKSAGLSSPALLILGNVVALSMKNEILEFALSLADAAEAEIMPVYRNCTVSFKSDGTEVTEADKRAEEVMRALIGKRFPGHQVLGEEFGGPQGPTTESLWVLDPIDGTTSFALGLPIFGTLIAYLADGEPQVGVVHFPAMGETIYAAKGDGCWVHLRGSGRRQVKVSQTSNIGDAFVSSGGTKPSDIQPSKKGPCYKLSSLIEKPRKFRFISDCVQHALVAQGRIDAAIDPEMNPWDIAALIPCVEEAGGVISDLEGARQHLTWKSSLLSSSTPELHTQILRVLQGVTI